MKLEKRAWNLRESRSGAWSFITTARDYARSRHRSHRADKRPSRRKARPARAWIPPRRTTHLEHSHSYKLFKAYWFFHGKARNSRTIVGLAFPADPRPGVKSSRRQAFLDDHDTVKRTRREFVSCGIRRGPWYIYVARSPVPYPSSNAERFFNFGMFFRHLRETTRPNL